MTNINHDPILFVDDQPFMLDSWRDLLEANQIEMDGATTVGKAIVMMESYSYPVVVIDGLNGECWKVRSAALEIGATAILYTGDFDIIEAAEQADIDIIPKYERPEKLLNKIKSILQSDD